MLTDEQVKEIKLKVGAIALKASRTALPLSIEGSSEVKLLEDIARHVEVEEHENHIDIAYDAFKLMSLPPYYSFIPAALQVPMVAAAIELFVVQNFGRKSVQLIRRM